MVVSLKGEYLVDTNILVYSLDRESPFFKRAAEILRACRKEEIKGVVAHQNLTELMAILTGIYGISLKSAINDAKNFLKNARLRLIHPQASTFLTFLRLLKKKRKIDIFDYYLAATMIDSKVKRILTKNKKDFQGIAQIKALDPFEN